MRGTFCASTDGARRPLSPPAGHRMRRTVIALCIPVVASAQATDQVKQFVSVDAPVVALTHARVIDVTGAIDSGRTVGPDLDATAPYLNGPGLPIYQVHALKDTADARQMVAHWADRGASSFKTYMQITRAELAAVVKEAHRRKLKVTGHLCSVTFREAATIGIDDLEHGLVVASDFVTGEKPDEWPTANGGVLTSLANLDVDGEPIPSLIRYLVGKHVALTSTLTVFETFVPGRPQAPQGALDAMLPEARDQYTRRSTSISTSTSPWSGLFPKEMRFELAFLRAGGLLLAGTDPTGYG